MSTDRELLELAAKAAGLSGFTFINGRGAIYDPLPDVMQPYRPWNPLTDDGDALRLAVTLSLGIEFDTLLPVVGVTSPRSDRFVGYRWYEWLNKDAAAATRRAVVRAAADIGEQS